MDGPPHRRQDSGRDINDLLLNGFYTSSRARSPAPPQNNAPAFLRALDTEPNSHRGRSRGPRQRPPPSPSCEDEVESLARELASTTTSDDEPPMRGILEQYPILIEAEVTAAERHRLHTAPRKEEDSDGSERRFVLVPQAESQLPNRDDEIEKLKRDKRAVKQGKQENTKAPAPKKETETSAKPSTSYPPIPKPSQDPTKDNKNHPPPPLERRKSSRQELPALKTKVDKDAHPQFRRSNSSYTTSPRECEMPKVTRATSDYMLSPEATPSARGSKVFLDPNAQSVPRYSNPGFNDPGYWSVSADRHSSVGSVSPSRPTAAQAERDRRNQEPNRSRRNTNDRLTKPQQLSEEYSSRRHRRSPSSLSERPRSPRSSGSNLRQQYSSDDDGLTDSTDSERRQRHHNRHKQSLHPAEDRGQYRRSPSASRKSTLDTNPSKYASSRSSPNISPSRKVRDDSFEPLRSDTFPRSRDERKNSRPVSPMSPNLEAPRASERLNPVEEAPRVRSRSRQRSSTIQSQATTAQAPQASLPVAIPSRVDVPLPRESPRSSIISQYDEPRSSSIRQQSNAKPYWEPPKFEPPGSSNNLERPIGSYRRYSEDIRRGSVEPLPSCPRTRYIGGRNDWLTLPQCPGFDICPSCYNAVMVPTEFRDHFIPSPIRGPNMEVLCDFGSNMWYRIAWLLTLKSRRRDLGLFRGLAKIANTEKDCVGSIKAERRWHSFIDPRTGRPVKNFDVCYACVKNVETVLPPIRGLFVRVESDRPVLKACSLRFDSKRFIKYFDALETTSYTADDSDGLDTRNLISLIKRLSLIDECQGDKDIMDQRWYTITQLPEFTVCEECYDDVIYPEVENGKAIPSMFNRSQQRIPVASCQLYSQRMQDMFQQAVDNDDYRYLASKARERKTVEAAHKANLGELKRIQDTNPEWAAAETARIIKEWHKWE